MKKLLLVLISVCALPSLAQTVTVPAGTFVMGDKNGESDERLEHPVTLSSFKIDRFEVTEAQYDSCVKAGHCTPAHYDDGKCLIWNGKVFQKTRVPSQYRNPGYPVQCVTWYQAQTYCRWKKMKLPTEAQWEYAAGCGSKSIYSWGNSTPDKNKCVFAGNGGPGQTGRCVANKCGLYDMTGNAWEWTGDNYEKDYYSYSEEKNPAGPPTSLYKVIRGGGWYSGPMQLRITNRHWFSPDFAEASIGFRCVQ